MLDSMTSATQISAFSSELQKIAARKGLKLIRGLIGKGDPGSLAKANRMAITPGVLKKTQAGSQVKQLGAGMEGVSTLTAHPKRGIEVRKLIDPKGIAGDKMVANREAAGRALSGSSDVAQFRGARTTPSGIREQRFEYAPGKGMDTAAKAAPAGGPSTAVGSGRAGVPAATPAATQPAARGLAQPQRVQAQMKRLKMQGKQQGFDIADLHEGNVMGGASGGGKAVDFIPVPKNKDVGLNKPNFNKAMEAQDAASAGKRTPYLDYLEDPRRAGNLSARAYAGAPPLTPGSSTALRQAKMPKPAAPAMQAPARRHAGPLSTAPSRPAVMPKPGLSTAPSRPKAIRPMAAL